MNLYRIDYISNGKTKFTTFFDTSRESALVSFMDKYPDVEIIVDILECRVD